VNYTNDQLYLHCVSVEQREEVRVAGKGWIAPSWPIEFGGMGLTSANTPASRGFPHNESGFPAQLGMCWN
jgi:hypothetical protein